MNVLFTLDSLGRGGAEVALLDVCRNAKDHGINVTFLASGGGEMEDEFRSSGVEFIKFERKMPLDPALIRKIRTVVAEREIAVIHGQQPVEALHFAIAGRGLRVKTAMSAQGLVMDRKNRVAAKLVLPRLDRVFAVSQAMLERYRDAGFDVGNFTVLPNCVDPKRLASNRGHDIRRELGLTPSQPLAGMIGNFYAHRAKDQLTVCRAAAEAIKVIPDLVVIFAGSVRAGGEAYYDRCRQFVDSKGLAANVKFLGGRSDVPDILDALDVLIFSSLYEGMPIGLIEAMLTSVPIVASEIAPIVETTGGTAALFPTGDDKELSRSLVDMFQSSEKRRRMAAAAKDRALASFSVDAHLGALRSHYEELLVRS